ncbi:MAG TPA: ABC transporter ATP-binding protein [Pyrinomonadaceae bacterium]|jgi:ABC-type multidrug transport system fused ATPase/permease subunit
MGLYPGDCNEIKWLSRQVKPFLSLHFISLSCVALESATVLLDPLIMKWLIDEVLPRRQVRGLILVAAAFLLTYASRLLFHSLSEMLNYVAVQKMVFKLRLSLFRHLQKLSAEYHERVRVGDTLYRLEQDIEKVSEIVSSFLPAALRVVVTSSLLLIAMFVLNFQLTCVVLPLIPAFILLRRHYGRRLRTYSDVAQEESGRTSSFLQEQLNTILQIQLLTHEMIEARKFARLAASNAQSQVRRRLAEAVFASSSGLIAVAGVASVLGYGGYQVVAGTLSVGGLVAFYGYAIQLFSPLYSIMDIYAKFQRVGASARRILDVKLADITVKDRPGSVALTQPSPGAIELKNVFFSYRTAKPVLTGINIRVMAGEKIALMGNSGNGKSTIAKLIARLYDVQEGAVLVDGKDVRDVRLKSLRTFISLVSQDSVVFDTSFRENLLYGNPFATQAELEDVVALTQLENLVQRLPNGWDERLGPRGCRLSGGERQRIAIARAVLQRPRILILDESTSSLDTLTEKNLLWSLREFVSRRTAIIISHRLSAVSWVDRILVLDQGKIVKEGVPADFHENDRTFRDLRRERVGHRRMYAR